MAALNGYLALGTLNAAGIFTEITGATGYARQAITFDVSDSGKAQNTSAIAFSKGRYFNWPKFNAYAFYSSASGGSPVTAWEAREPSDMDLYGPQPRSIGTREITVQFPASALPVTPTGSSVSRGLGEWLTSALSNPRPAWPSATWLAPDNLTAVSNSAMGTASVETYLPFVVPSRTTLAAMGLYLVTPQAGAECRLGLYTSNSTTGKPDALVIDAGVIDLSTGTNVSKEAATNVVLEPGVYWSCSQMKGIATPATLARLVSVAGPHLGYSSMAQVGAGPAGASRYYFRGITYGSPLLTTASGAIAAAAGTEGVVIGLKSA